MSPATIDVYSDASAKKGAGAWGAVIVRPGRDPLEASGRFRGPVESSTHGELRAAANAVHAALCAGMIKPGDTVVVRCDNRVAVQRINGERFRRAKTNRREDLAEPVEWIVDTGLARGFAVRAEWVQGHQRADSPDPHAVHNRRADRLCCLLAETRAVRKSRRRSRLRVRARARLATAEAAQ